MYKVSRFFLVVAVAFALAGCGGPESASESETLLDETIESGTLLDETVAAEETAADPSAADPSATGEPQPE